MARRAAARIPEIRAMRPLACPLDLFVYTTDELRELADAGAPLVAIALRDGVDLLSALH